MQRNRIAGGSLSNAPTRLVVAVLTALVALVAGGAITDSVSAPAGATSPSPWTIVPTPKPAAIEYVLYGVSCTSWTQCVAVGASENASHVYRTLAEEWNGAQWSLMSSPDQGSGDNRLTGVSCSSPTSCVAVGYDYATPSLPQTLVESWDGTSWTIATSPDQGNGDNMLSGVSCTSPTDCVAVGSSYGSTGVWQTLVESWDGTSWTVATSPDPGSGDNSLSAVSCATSTSCLAVGAEGGSGSGADRQTLVESWDGTSWTSLTSPDPGSVSNFLTGVSCTGADQCQAVGAFATKGTVGYTSNTARTMVVTWNGTSVNLVPSPQEGAASNFPEGVSCLNASSCVMAGWNYVPGAPGDEKQVALVEMAAGTTADTTQPSVTPSPAVAGRITTYQASVTPSSGSGTPTGGVNFAIGATDLCTATLVNGTGSCTSAQAPLGADTVSATYFGDLTYAWSSGTTPLYVTLAAPSVTCAKAFGSASTTLTMNACSPTSSTNKSASGPASVLTSGGTLKWTTSGGTTVASWSTSSPGRRACPVASTELELSGVVTGGTSTYTKNGDPITIDLCKGLQGGLTLAPSTSAKL